MKQVNDQGGILGGKMSLVLGDSKCDPQSSVGAANKLVNVENVAGIVGAPVFRRHNRRGQCRRGTGGRGHDLSGLDLRRRSPHSRTRTSSSRVAPSDSFQGKVLARAVLARGIEKVALTYVKNDYGKGLADNFRAAFTKGGGAIAGDQAHEDKKSSYRSELATLSKGGAKHLVLVAYPQSSGAGHHPPVAGRRVVRQVYRSGSHL